MPGTPTTRLSIPTINGAVDSPATYAGVNLAQMNIVDSLANYLPAGTLVACPSSPPEGSFYRATDTGLLYEYNGTIWQTVMLASAWQTLTLESGVSAGGGYTPAARLVGDTVQLCGSATGSAIATWATLPVVLRPASAIEGATEGGFGIALSYGISTGGVISAAPNSGAGFSFDGVTPFRLS